MIRQIFLSAVTAAMLAGAGSAMAQSTADKRFTAVVSLSPDTTDPMQTILTPNVLPVFGNIQDELVPARPDNKPGVATWDIKDGGKTIDFHLKPGIKFSSGDPLTADDVIFSYERAMQKAISLKVQMAGSSVEKIDGLTVRFHFTAPNTSMMTQGAFFIGSKAYHDRVGEQDYVAHPVGTGPYKLTSYQVGQYFDLDAWDGYWGPQPDIKHARIRIVKESSTSVQMLKTGEADIVFQLPYNQIAPLTTQGFHFAYELTPPTVAINFQMYNPNTPWAKKEVREAIGHAIDNEAIIKGLLAGVPKNDGLLTKGEIGYGANLGPFKYDPALAKKMLADAGYPNGFSMPYYVPDNFYGQAETAEAVTLYLKAVGINLDVKPMDAVQINALLAKRSKDPTFEFTFQRSLSVANNGDPAGSLLYAFSKASATSEFKTDDPAFEQGIADATGEFDTAKRGVIVNKVLGIIHDSAGVVPIWDAVTVYAMKPQYSYKPFDHEQPRMDIWNISVTK